MRRNREAAERYAERRRQEDEAPRLREVVPRLSSLRVDFEETRVGATATGVTHTRRVVVERAPALFLVACGDKSCRDGGHDVTSELLRGLREERSEIRGDNKCRGQCGNVDCARLLLFTAAAEYADPA